jgi:hypothetical protein
MGGRAEEPSIKGCAFSIGAKVLLKTVKYGEGEAFALWKGVVKASYK